MGRELKRDFSKITQVDKSDNFVATKSKVKSRHRGSGTGSSSEARTQVPGKMGLGSLERSWVYGGDPFLKPGD